MISVNSSSSSSSWWWLSPFIGSLTCNRPSRTVSSSSSHPSSLVFSSPVVYIPYTLLSTYLVLELSYYTWYRLYLIPKANNLKDYRPQEYPGIYKTNRIALFDRMLSRAERTCRLSNRCIREYITEYFLLLVRKKDNKYKDVNILETAIQHVQQHKKQQSEEEETTTTTTATSLSTVADDDSLSSSSSSSLDSRRRRKSSSKNYSRWDSSMSTSSTISDDSTGSLDTCYNSQNKKMETFYHPIVCKEDIIELLAFGFFAKKIKAVKDWEYNQICQMITLAKERFGVLFKEGGNQYNLVPRKVSLDNVDTLHRPLIYYAIVKLYKTLGNNVLRLLGFKKYVSKSTGLICWHKPILEEKTSGWLLPTLFFHGIAPSGLPMYLPMILSGLAYETDRRPLFLFETPYIASEFNWKLDPNKILTKQQTVQGVYEILNLFPYTNTESNSPLAIIGHSFGTFTTTWLIHHDSILRNRIKQIIVLDPVSILLSEPDLMKNFECPPLLFWLFGTSEFNINYYVRRQFAWYNSELWLEDIPKDCFLTIGLAHNDDMLNAPKILREVVTYAQAAKVNSNDTSSPNARNNTKHSNFIKNTKIFYWGGGGEQEKNKNIFSNLDYYPHGYCVLFPSVWKEIKNVMLQHESQIIKDYTLQQQQIITTVTTSATM